MNLDRPGRAAIDVIPIIKALKHPNKYWRFFESHVNDIFGQIAEFEDGFVIDEERFEKCYVSEWYKDELEMVPKAAFPQTLILDMHPDFEQVRNMESTKEIAETLLPRNQQKILLFLGDIGIGKTCLLGRFTLDYKHKAFIPYISVRGADSCEDINSSISMQLRELILAQETDFLNCLGKRKPQVDFDIFEKEMRNIEGELKTLPNEDAKNRRRYKEINQTKADPILYTKRLVSFFRKNNVPSCIIIDGGDFFDNHNLQSHLFVKAHRLCESLNCCILLALRETSILKAHRRSKVSEHEGDIRYHLLPPKGWLLLQKRCEYLTERLRALPDAIFAKAPLTRNSAINFIKATLESFLQNVEDYEKLANYSVRTLLDYCRCFIMSGNLDDEDLAVLCQGRQVNPHKIMKSLLLYTYSHFTKRINLILNVYDNNENHLLAYGQNLIRVRCLQAIRTLSLESGARGSARTADVVNLLESAGYKPHRTRDALTTLFDVSLIDTPERSARVFDENVEELKLTVCGSYYYESLIRTVRYCQCVTTATHVCEEVYHSIFTPAEQTHDRVRQVLIFARFLTECERRELEMTDNTRKVISRFEKTPFTLSLYESLLQEIIKMDLPRDLIKEELKNFKDSAFSLQL